MSTIQKFAPNQTGECLSVLVPEKAIQVFKANAFVWQASGETAVQGTMTAAAVVPETAKIAFVLEDAHNYAAANSFNSVEVLRGDKLIEITFNGDPTAAQIAIGAELAITTIANPENAYDSASRPYIDDVIWVAMVPDVDNIAMVRVVDIAGRGIVSNGKIEGGTPMHTGDHEDVNPRIVVQILPEFVLAF